METRRKGREGAAGPARARTRTRTRAPRPGPSRFVSLFVACMRGTDGERRESQGRAEEKRTMDACVCPVRKTKNTVLLKPAGHSEKYHVVTGLS